MPSIRDRAFVEVALRRGAIDPDRLHQAQASHQELAKFGIQKFIGAVVVEKGLASKGLVDEIVDELKASWIRCPGCKEPNALSKADRNGFLSCSHCEAPIDYPAERISESDLSINLQTSARGRRGGREKSKGEAGDPPASGQRSAVRPTERVGSGKPLAESSGRGANRAGAGRPPAGAPMAPRSFDSISGEELAPYREITKFKVEKLLGASAAGKLYRIVESSGFGALKVIDRALTSDKVHFKQWIDFMQRIQDLPSAATLKPTQLFREGSLTYVVRPFLAAPDASLREHVKFVGGPMTAEALIEWARGLLAALAVFHGMHLVHGNIKPENILLTKGGVRLCDPGLHLLFEGLPAEERALRLWENASYHAPEVLQGGEISPATDVYSAGKVLEEMLAAVDRAAGPGRSAPSGAGGREWLDGLVQRMTAADPTERFASAKEALRELSAAGHEPKRATAAPQKAPRKTKGPAPRRQLPSRLDRLRTAGYLLLGLAFAALCWQGVSWFQTRSAIASPRRLEEVSDRLVAEEVRSLERRGHEGSLAIAEARARWQDLSALCKGTPWEERIREASRQALEALERKEEEALKPHLERARAQADKGEWIAALATLLEVEARLETSRSGTDLLQRVADGIYTKEAMVYVPRGDVERGGEKDRRATAVGPFLADARLLSRSTYAGYLEARKLPAQEPVPGGDSPLLAVSLPEAQAIGAWLGKRLPAPIEWDRLASLAAPAAADSKPRRPLEVLAAGRLEGFQGGPFQWVQDEAPDDLSRAGNGWCRGGDRPGVPPTHPLRRERNTGHADVGVRLVKDIPPASGPAVQ